MSNDQNKQQEPPERIWQGVDINGTYMVIERRPRDVRFRLEARGGYETLFYLTGDWPQQITSALSPDLAQPLPDQQKITEAAEEIARRWLQHDLTPRAAIMSSQRQQLRNLIGDVLLSLLSDTSTQRCVNCGHADGVDAAGTCLHGISDTGSKTWDCPCKCVFGPTDVERGEQRGGGEWDMMQEFANAKTHDDLVDLVWAYRATVDADTFDAPFFTAEAIGRSALFGQVLGMYFEHAPRVLGRSPWPAEVDQIEMGFCRPGADEIVRKGMERGRRVLAERGWTTPPAPVAEAGEPGCEDDGSELGQALRRIAPERLNELLNNELSKEGK